MRIRWSEPASADLSAIHDFISQDAPGGPTGSSSGSSRRRSPSASSRIVVAVIHGARDLARLLNKEE
jgi:plasmid stabilization system protein ParE